MIATPGGLPPEPPGGAAGPLALVAALTLIAARCPCRAVRASGLFRFWLPGAVCMFRQRYARLEDIRGFPGPSCVGFRRVRNPGAWTVIECASKRPARAPERQWRAGRAGRWTRHRTAPR